MAPTLSRISLVALLFALVSSASAQGGKRLDQDGAPLPERAICRLGSNRFLHPRFLTRTAFASDGKRFASADADGNVILWEWPTGKLVRKFEVPFSTVIVSACDEMRFSPDGRFLAINNGEIHFLRITDGKLYSKGESIGPPAFAPQGK